MTATVRVIEAGGLGSVQDAGRAGFAASGVPAGGAADTLSLRIGNRLLGNEEYDAAIESTLVGGSFRFDAPALVCLAGSECPDAAVEGGERRRPLPRWAPTVVRAGSLVRIGPIRGGARSYLCIAGGVRTAPVLGSRSVHAPSGIGGRPLRAGDTLPIGAPPPGVQVAPLDRRVADGIGAIMAGRTLRVVPGAHAVRFDADIRAALVAQAFRVGTASDRTGVRLEGGLPTGNALAGGSLEKSEGMVPGAVQVPPSGEAIVLGVDAPTVGGYPVIASVIGADLPVLGQLAPGDAVRFAWVDLAGARNALRDLDAMIARVALPVRSAHYEG